MSGFASLNHVSLFWKNVVYLPGSENETAYMPASFWEHIAAFLRHNNNSFDANSVHYHISWYGQQVHPHYAIRCGNWAVKLDILKV